LVRAITSFRGDDRAIGLEGPWGSGKSTVVEIARRKLAAEGERAGVAYNFFTFDIWQSQGASFRRSFLEHFLDWSRATFPQKDAQIEDVERKVKGKVRQVQSNNQLMLDWWGIGVVLFIPFLPIYYFWAKAAFDAAEKTGESFLWSSPFVALLLFVVATLLKASSRCWKGLRRTDRRGLGYYLARYREALSQTLLISAKQYENQKVTQHIRETDPNDFEFQSTLRELLSVVQSEKSRVVIVLDNIDRLPKKRDQ
jgi:ABC-type multidrug transport system fused ATPase/permease subunit